MILPEKVAHLKRSGLHAVRLALLWEDKIALSGIKSAEDLYLSLGHNHIERKSVDFDGLTLRREPRDTEKIAVKGVSEAQDAGKTQVSAILMELRSGLISDAIKAIRKLSPATYHELVLTVPDKYKADLKEQLRKVYRKGRKLVASELGKTKAAFDFSDVTDELDDIVDLTDGRVINEIQARIVAATARNRLLGLKGTDLWKAVEKEVGDGSTGWLERIATGATNKVLNVGRGDEMSARADEIDRYEQSELLDQNTCGPCAEDDGKTAADPDDLPGAPNPDCEGGDWCRGFIVAIAL